MSERGVHTAVYIFRNYKCQVNVHATADAFLNKISILWMCVSLFLKFFCGIKKIQHLHK